MCIPVPEGVARLDAALSRYVRPATFPTGVRRFGEGEDLPERTKIPERDLGTRLTTCQAYNLSRRIGWTIGLGPEDSSCIPGMFVQGFARMPEYYTRGDACVGMYARTRDAARLTESEVARFDPDSFARLVFAPLSRCTFEPEMALIYCNSAQANLLVCASLYERGGRLHTSGSGRLDCSDAIVRTILEGQCRFIIPCNGDRVYAGVEDHEVLFTIPRAEFIPVSESLESLHRNGIRYPVPRWLLYEPSFPEQYNVMRKMIGGE